MKFGISLNVNDRIVDTVTKSQEAEHLGLDYVWISDLPSQRYAPVVASAVASSTHKMRVGLGLISPFLHTPQQIASSLITLLESYGDRFDLCIGPGDRDELYNVGVDLKAIGNTSEYLIKAKKEIQECLKKRDHECKIWLGAQGPRLIKITSSFDGVLLNYASPNMIEWALRTMQNDEHKIHQAMGIFTPSYVYRECNPEIYKILQFASATVALGTTESVLREFSQLELLEPARKELKLKPLDRSILKLIPPEIFEKFSIFKSQDELPEYLDKLDNLGIEHVVFAYPQSYSIKTVRELAEILSRKLR